MQENEESVLASLDSAIAGLDNQCSTGTNTLELIARVQKMLRSDEISLADKSLQYSLLKYQQILTGLMLHADSSEFGACCLIRV